MRRGVKALGSLLLCATAQFSNCAWAEGVFSSKFVTVEVSRNLPPPTGHVFGEGCLRPDRAFQISAYEVSNAEYAAFLNSVASENDPHALFSAMQTEHFWGGVVRVGQPGRYEYRVKAGYARLPVTFVSWPDAMRYANWLHHGRPDLRGKGEAVEAVLNAGAYELAKGRTLAGAVRRKNARYFVPDCGEWRLAGFVRGKHGGAQAYATGDIAPASAGPGASQPSANYYHHHWALPFPHLAAVDDYQASAGPHGTVNQAGNVMEWVESPVGRDQQMALGGSLFLPEDALRVGYQDSELPEKKLSSFGFRVARAVGIDEPIQVPYVEQAPRQETSAKGVSSASAAAWVRIGRPGNVSDWRTGVGCVPYVYELAGGEVTNAQYVEFLNAVASAEDLHQLFVPDMETGVVGGVLRVKNGKHWRYEAKPGMADRPAAYLSWFALARFANWLHHGRPAGRQVIGVTEGTKNQGAYDTSRFDDFERGPRAQVVDKGLFRRNVGAKYFIPTDDEWYKAAYYDPERAGVLKYWTYPSRSDSPPANKGLGGANFQNDHLGEGGPYFVSQRGAHGPSGYFPLNDMAGNLWEWLEDWRGLGGEPCWRCDIPTKGLRGGSFNYVNVGLLNSNVDPGYPSDRYFVYGGRLARSVESGETGWCVPHDVRQQAAHLSHRLSWKMGLAGLGGMAALMGLLALWRRRKAPR